MSEKDLLRKMDQHALRMELVSIAMERFKETLYDEDYW